MKINSKLLLLALISLVGMVQAHKKMVILNNTNLGKKEFLEFDDAITTAELYNRAAMIFGYSPENIRIVSFSKLVPNSGIRVADLSPELDDTLHVIYKAPVGGSALAAAGGGVDDRYVAIANDLIMAKQSGNVEDQKRYVLSLIQWLNSFGNEGAANYLLETIWNADPDTYSTYEQKIFHINEFLQSMLKFIELADYREILKKIDSSDAEIERMGLMEFIDKLESKPVLGQKTIKLFLEKIIGPIEGTDISRATYEEKINFIKSNLGSRLRGVERRMALRPVLVLDTPYERFADMIKLSLTQGVLDEEEKFIGRLMEWLDTNATNEVAAKYILKKLWDIDVDAYGSQEERVMVIRELLKARLTEILATVS